MEKEQDEQRKNLINELKLLLFEYNNNNCISISSVNEDTLNFIVYYFNEMIIKKKS